MSQCHSVRGYPSKSEKQPKTTKKSHSANTSRTLAGSFGLQNGNLTDVEKDGFEPSAS